MLYLEKIKCSLVCLNDKVVYFAALNQSLNWEKHGFYSLSKENLIHNVWLKEQEIKSKKERINAGRIKRTAIGSDFRHLPLGIDFIGSYEFDKIKLNKEGYKIITVILCAANSEPEIEHLLATLKMTIDIPTIKNNLDSIDFMDGEEIGYWSFARIAKLLNLLNFKDEENNAFSELKIRNTLFFWNLVNATQLQVDLTSSSSDIELHIIPPIWSNLT
jgi:hypothetical protein